MNDDEIIKKIQEKLGSMSLNEMILYFESMGLSFTGKIFPLYLCVYTLNGVQHIDYFKIEMEKILKNEASLNFTILYDNIVLFSGYINTEKNKMTLYSNTASYEDTIVSLISYQDIREYLINQGIISEYANKNQPEKILEYVKENYSELKPRFQKPITLKIQR